MWAYLLDVLQNSEHLVNIRAVKFNLACEFSNVVPFLVSSKGLVG